MDGGAWWAAVYGVAQSQTRLKRLSSSKMLWKELKLHLRTLRTSLSLLLSKCCGGEGNGNPLQYSCLENPMEEGAW